MSDDAGRESPFWRRLYEGWLVIAGHFGEVQTLMHPGHRLRIRDRTGRRCSSSARDLLHKRALRGRRIRLERGRHRPGPDLERARAPVLNDARETAMNILGISCFYHDSAAALLRDGDLVAAAHEERFTRKRHDPDLPKQAVEYCLAEAGHRRSTTSTTSSSTTSRSSSSSAS